MFLIYQIKVGLCLIAFYLLWKLLLSRETFHRFNRVALLTVMVLALVLPWIRLSLDAPASVASRMVVLDEIFVGPAGAAQPHRNASSWTEWADRQRLFHRHGSGAHVVFAQPLEPVPLDEERPSRVAAWRHHLACAPW